MKSQNRWNRIYQKQQRKQLEKELNGVANDRKQPTKSSGK